MQAKATASETKKTVTTHEAKFAKVLDGRKQPVRGLWVRNGRYYGRLNVENPVTGVKRTRWTALVDKAGSAVGTVSQAIAELRRLQTHRADDTLRELGRQDKFKDYAKEYMTFLESGGDHENPKALGTVAKEKTILGRWTDHLGDLRLDQVKRLHVNRFIEKRMKEKVSRRTINLDVITFRVVMKRALSDGKIQRLPTDGLKPFKTTTPKRELVTAAEIERFCTAALGKRDGSEVPVTENAQEFADYIRLMALSGARRNEALGLMWGDVGTNQLTFRRQVISKKPGIAPLKNREERTINLNPKLKAHLADMKQRSGNVSQWLFPSPQRGDKDIPAKSFRESLDLVRAAAKMPKFNFHDCRHHFISMCVMSGIDFMTIAAWVGHRDGGVLIGKVYGHLANEHREAMAERLNFGPAIVAA